MHLRKQDALPPHAHSSVQPSAAPRTCPNCRKPVMERGMLWADGIANLCTNPLHGPLLYLSEGTAMYPLEYTKDGRTLIHSRHCKAAFGRYDWACARCCELQAGAQPRKSGHRAFLVRKLREAGQRSLGLTA